MNDRAYDAVVMMNILVFSDAKNVGLSSRHPATEMVNNKYGLAGFNG
jgi:hypothetical protein